MNEYGLDLLRRKIKSIEDSLTSSDLKIVRILLDDPKKFVYMTVTEIAKRSNTSVASVTRFTKKLGYDGLADLKISISSEMEISLYGGIHLDVDIYDSASVLIRKIFDGNVEAIRDTEKILKEDDLVKVIDFISNSRRLIFFGIGGSSSIAIDAHHKFIRTGKTVEVVTDPHKQMLIASVSTKDDLIIAISHEGVNIDLNETLKVAKENKAKVVAITQFSNSPITQIADICLFTLTRETNYRPESLTSRVAAHTITDTLYVGYAMRINDVMNKNLTRIRENMRKLKKDIKK